MRRNLEPTMKRRRPATLEPIAASAFVIVSLHVALTAGLFWWWQNTQAREQSAPAPLAWLSPADFKNSLASGTLAMGTTSAAPERTGTAKPARAGTPPPAEPPVPKATLISPPPPAAEPAPAAAAPAPAATASDPPKATLLAGPPDSHRMEAAPNDGAAPLFAPPTPAPKPSANRSITLRRIRTKPVSPATGKSPPPPMSSPSLLDIARLNSMRPSSPPKPGATPPPVDDVDNNTELDPVDEALNAAFLAIWSAPPIDAVPPGQREARLNLSVGRDGSILKAQMNKFSGSHALDQSILEAAANVKKIPVTLPSNYSKDSYDVELNFLLLP